jgi:hypothetical protein
MGKPNWKTLEGLDDQARIAWIRGWLSQEKDGIDASAPKAQQALIADGSLYLLEELSEQCFNMYGDEYAQNITTVLRTYVCSSPENTVRVLCELIKDLRWGCSSVKNDILESILLHLNHCGKPEDFTETTSTLRVWLQYADSYEVTYQIMAVVEPQNAREYFIEVFRRAHVHGKRAAFLALVIQMFGRTREMWEAFVLSLPRMKKADQDEERQMLNALNAAFTQSTERATR